MTEIGFKYVVESEDNWDEHYLELKKFVEENGHCLVPRETPGLGPFIGKNRMNYKLWKQGKPTKNNYMTAERVDLLNEIGFIFDATKVGYHATKSKPVLEPLEKEE